MERYKQENHLEKKHKVRHILLFLLPSLLGVLLFLVPIKIDDSWTVIIGYTSSSIEQALSGVLPSFFYLAFSSSLGLCL